MKHWVIRVMAASALLATISIANATTRGRVLMLREGGDWRFAEADPESVGE